MLHDSQRHHRRSLRLKGYDYSRAGMYFVTICTQGRQSLFGEMVAEEMVRNRYGQVVWQEWHRSAEIRREVKLDVFVVMPNHIHGVVMLVEPETSCVGATGRSPLRLKPGPPPRSLGSLIAGFKSATTKRINDMRGTPGTMVWQRNYYEHIIRSEKALERIQDYILTNPLRWDLDRENLRRQSEDDFDCWLASLSGGKGHR